MKLDSDQTLRPAATAAAARSGWGAAVVVTAAVVALLVAMYYDTAASIVAIWYRSETFTHGFLVLPAVLWLIWRRRDHVAQLTPRPDYAGLVLLAGLGFGWLLAELAGVQVIQQLAMVAMIPAAVVTVMGRRVAWALAFPLGFLFFGVPIGEGLIPPLMNFTADFTVAMLQLVGIPVYREGTFFTIPSGNWSVVEGCSGLRYVIASVTAGCLYAYLNYQSFGRRALFVAASIAVPVIANGLRAFMIVMIAHLSDMKLALGVDHFIYGWVFFGIVMVALFWAGSFWHEPEPGAAGAPADSGGARVDWRRTRPAALAVLAVVAAWPAYAAYLERADRPAAPERIAAPQGAAGWQPDRVAITDWRPRYVGADPSLFEVYRNGDRAVAVYIGYYRHQRQGAELVNSQNVMVPQKDPAWESVGESRRAEPLQTGTLAVKETLLRSRSQRLLVWDWMVLDGRRTTNSYLAKLLLAKNRLLGQPDDGVAIILAAPYSERPELAEQTLREFVRDMLPEIESSIRAAAGS
jgi:exosortase A